MSDEIEQASPVESSPPEPQSDPSPQDSGSPQASSPWDAFKQLPQFAGKDDRAIASGLYQALQREQAASHALRQYQSILPVAQEYATHRPEFEKWRALQAQQAQAAQQPQQQKWWNPPEVKESYRRYLVKDEAGRDTIAPNAPYEAQVALSEYMNYRADFASKFLTDPEAALGPMVAEMAQKQAQELIRETLQQRDRESFVSEFERANNDWLVDPATGTATVEGEMFYRYVEQARAFGIPPGQERAQYATDMTELALRRMGDTKAAPQAAPVPQEAAPVEAPVQPPVDRARENMAYLRKEASRSPSRSAGAASADPRLPRQSRSFEQMLADNLRQAGAVN